MLCCDLSVDEFSCCFTLAFDDLIVYDALRLLVLVLLLHRDCRFMFDFVVLVWILKVVVWVVLVCVGCL